MITLHPEFLSKDGKREFVVLPYVEFVALHQILAAAADLIDLREARAEEGSSETMSLSEVKALLDLED